jgi:hypothetical protein
LDFSEGLSDPGVEPFGNFWEEELQHTLDDQLRRNLLDSIMGITEEHLCNQSGSYGRDEHEISFAFRLWSPEETDAHSFDGPGRHWHTLHGHLDRFDLLAGVVVRFITLACSEADVER